MMESRKGISSPLIANMPRVKEEASRTECGKGRRPRKAAFREKPCVSKEALTSINFERASIAEMRPARRKLKWGSALADWDRKSDKTTARIKVGIDLEELQVLGGVPMDQSQKDAITNGEGEHHESTTDLSCEEGIEGEDPIEKFEKRINKTYDSIKRITQENDDLDKEVERLKQENQTLRHDIAVIPMGKSSVRKGTNQLQHLEKKLKSKLREMERQCVLLRRRKIEIERTRQRLGCEDVQDEIKSFSTQTSKSITTILELDSEEEETIVVFSARKAEEGDSEQEGVNLTVDDHERDKSSSD